MFLSSPAAKSLNFPSQWLFIANLHQFGTDLFSPRRIMNQATREPADSPPPPPKVPVVTVQGNVIPAQATVIQATATVVQQPGTQTQTTPNPGYL